MYEIMHKTLINHKEFQDAIHNGGKGYNYSLIGEKYFGYFNSVGELNFAPTALVFDKPLASSALLSVTDEIKPKI